MPSYEIRPAREQDDEALLALHNRCFTAQWDAAWWRWRFRSLDPRDVAILGAFDPRGDAVGMYAGVRLRMRLRGENVRILGQCDVSIATELREGLGGARLLARLAQRFCGEEIGALSPISYGYPMPALRRVMHKVIGSQTLCDVVFLVCTTHDSPPRASTLDVRSVERFGADVDSLWATVAEELGTALVRDAAYCNWRYAEHPVPYRLLEARDGTDGSLRGLAVVRRGGIRPEVASLVEWLVPLADAEAEAALLGTAHAFAREEDCAALVAWFASTGEHFRRFQERHGFIARATAYQELVFWRGLRLQRDELHAAWYQTMGDIDFF